MRLRFFYSVRSRTYYWVKFSAAAQLDRAEIANFAPVLWAMLLNSKEVKRNYSTALRCAYDSTDFGQVYWGLDLPQSVMSDVRSGYRRLGIRHCVHTVNRYRPVPGTRTCGNQLAWYDNGRLVSKYSCLNERLVFTVSIQTVEFVNGRVACRSRVGQRSVAS